MAKCGKIPGCGYHGVWCQHEYKRTTVKPERRN